MVSRWPLNLLSATHKPMPAHDIIDNRREKLVDHINRILSSTESARFAVGYFFLSGLESIAQRLAGVKELRLLIGNTTNRETLEQLAEGYRRLDLVAEAAEAEAYPKRTETKRMAGETAGNIRSAIELTDQTDEAQATVTALVRMIEDEGDEFLDLNEGEEILRQLRKEDPAEYERIADLRNGIRAGKASSFKGQFVFCEASLPERESSKGFQQLFLLD